MITGRSGQITIDDLRMWFGDDQTVEVEQVIDDLKTNGTPLVESPNALHQSTDLDVHSVYYHPVFARLENFVSRPMAAIYIDSPTTVGIRLSNVYESGSRDAERHELCGARTSTTYRRRCHRPQGGRRGH